MPFGYTSLMDKNVSKQHLTKIWDDLGLSRSDQVHDWTRRHKENHNKYTCCSSPFSFIVLLFILYAVCRQGYSMFDHKSLTLLRQYVDRENRSMKRHTKSAPYTITHTVCQTGITFVHEWIIFITTDPKREKERAKVGVRGGREKSSVKSGIQAFSIVILMMPLQFWLSRVIEKWKPSLRVLIDGRREGQRQKCVW